MIKRSTIIIDPKKSEEFKEFMRKNAKNESFWRENKESISRPIDKARLEALFDKK